MGENGHASGEARERKLKVGVVGTGMSGLSCAWHLSTNGGADVTILDSHPAAGLSYYSTTVHLETSCSETARTSPSSSAAAKAAKASPTVQGVDVDVPMRMMVPDYYGTLLKLYAHIGVEAYEFNSSSSLRAYNPDSKTYGAPYFRYCNTATSALSQRARLIISVIEALLGITNKGIVAVPGFDLPNCGVFHQILGDLLLFRQRAPRDHRLGLLGGMTIHQYLLRNGYTKTFMYKFVYPYMSIVCTVGLEKLQHYPAKTIIEYLFASIFTASPVCRVKESMKSVSERLSKNVASHRYGVRVQRIEPFTSTSPDGSSHLKVKVVTSTSETFYFDKVVVATQANQAVTMLSPSDFPRELIAALSSFRYERTSTILHRDERFYPRSVLAQNTQFSAKYAESPIPSSASDPRAPPVFFTSSSEQKFQPAPKISTAKYLYSSFSDTPPMKIVTNFNAAKSLMMAAAAASSSSSNSNSNRSSNRSSGRSSGRSSNSSSGSGSLPSSLDEEESKPCLAPALPCTSATCCLNIMYPNLKECDLLLQTWNPHKYIDPGQVLRTVSLERSTVTLETLSAISTIQRHQGHHGVYLCGSYSLEGIPLLESAASSGLLVAEMISGVDRPWAASPQKVGVVRPLPLSTYYFLRAFLYIYVSSLYVYLKCIDVLVALKLVSQ